MKTQAKQVQCTQFFYICLYISQCHIIIAYISNLVIHTHHFSFKANIIFRSKPTASKGSGCAALPYVHITYIGSF